MQDPIALSASELDKTVKPFLLKYAYVDQRNIASFTEQFCVKFNLNSIPRDPFTLLPEHFGIHIERMSRPSNVPAQWMLDSDADRYVIQTSSYRTSRALVLSVFHEFFEILSSNESFPSRLGSTQECELAWQFATHITMPEKIVRTMAADLGHPDICDKTDVLASRFNVSLSAMRLRLKILGISAKPNRFR